jgi:hypothetical protein
MHRDDTDLTIRNQRPRPHTGVAVASLVGTFFLGWCGLCTLNLGSPWAYLWAGGTFVALCAATGLALFASHPVYDLQLGTVLTLRPSGVDFVPTEIVGIEFGPDPHEDYVDLPAAGRLCEVRVVLPRLRPVVVCASVRDAIRLRDWATRNRIPVSDPTDALGRT